VKFILKLLLPRSWWLRLRDMKRWRWFRGSYSSWTEARAASTGYDDSAVLARVLAATRKVRAGSASWERDGWAFDLPELNLPLVSALKVAAEECDGKLDVVDFGGSLGSTWWQNSSVLGDFKMIHWRVVEQPHFVKAGREFATDQLNFYATIDEAQRMGSPTVILFSSVLPYIEKPYELLKEMDRRGFLHVFLDRTPFVRTGGEQLVVQHTPPELGGGSYPSWLFDRSRIIASLGPNFELKAEWLGSDLIDPRVEYMGFHFQRRVSSLHR
jgi:putative methyltransferase (TIGR04325 family)